MKLRNLLEALQKTAIMEATRYDGMFAAILKLLPEWHKIITDNTDWARTVLKREDRIVWYLRWVRLDVLVLEENSPSTNNADNKLFVEKLANKLFSDMSKSTGEIINYNYFDTYSLRRLQEDLIHLLSLPVHQIQAYQFSNQTPKKLIKDLKIFENIWIEQQKKKKQYLQPQEGDQIIINFGDGWSWWMLNRGSCSDEANAMGHCGNVPSEQAGQKVLSLRRQGDGGHRPSLTFILDSEGWLGEMKGRGNEKPAPKYYPYIIKLLELPIIKGLKGGGYEPQNNFNLRDLPDAESIRLAQLKPTLADAVLIYELFGPTEEFGQRAMMELRELDLPVPRSWDNENKLFIIEIFNNVATFVNHFGNDQLKNAINGDEPYDYYPDIDDSSLYDLYTDLNQQLLDKITLYVENTYKNEIEAAGLEDELDDRDVFQILSDVNDNIIDELRTAVDDGYQNGTQGEIHRYMIRALLDGFDSFEHIAEVSFEFDSNNNIMLNSPCMMTVSPDNMIKVLEDDDLADTVSSEGWATGGEIELNEPNGGWFDYDQKFAVQTAEELISHIIS